MSGMWKRCAGLMLLLPLATACVAVGERPGDVLRRDFPAVAIRHLGAHDFLHVDFSDRAVLNALHRTMEAGVAKDRIEKVTLTASYGRLGATSGKSGGRPNSYDLWLRIADCDKLVFMGANFNGRVRAIQDKGGCLKPATGSAAQ
ncbi:MAG: hypothetical protein ACTSQ7_09575 [Alphaproteobacteria bacterium]